MSKPQPSPKSNFLQIMLIATTVFLAVQLFTPNKGNQDTRSSDELWAEMQQFNRDLKDVSIRALANKYESKVREEAKSKNLDAAETDKKVLAGYLLAADTMRKSGLYRHQLFVDGKAKSDFGYRKLDHAYQLLKPKFETFSHGPLWDSTTVEVTPTTEVAGTSFTARQVYDGIVTDQAPLAKLETVWGLFNGYGLIDFLVASTGRQPGFSYWFAGFLLALVVRAVIWPLAQKQLMHGRRMMQLQPLMKEIKEKYTDKNGQIKKQAEFQAESMGLYRKYGINPMAGCLPALIQMPLFLAVYQSMHLYKFDFVKGTFLWINHGATTFLGIPLAPNLGERDYILIVVYMASMVTSTLLMPVSDPSNYKQQRIMGVSVAVIFSVMMFFYTLPSAFVLYWIFTNVLSTTQSLLSHRLPLPELAEVQTVAGGVKPKGGFMETLARMSEEAAKKQDSANGQANGKPAKDTVSPEFFGKTGTPKLNKAKKRK